MVVWGSEYVDMLLNVALPCLLAPGNLPGVTNINESRFLIITTSQDRNHIESSRVFNALKDLIHTEFIEPSWIEESIPYWLKAARGHQLAAKIAAEHAAYCVYLAPDFLLADGGLRRLVDLAAAGKTAVLVPGIRVTTETVVPEVQSAYASDSRQVMSIAPRALVQLCLRHIHPENQRYNWGHPHFSGCPVVCTWNVEGENGLLVRAFHLHPLLVRMSNPESLALLDSNTIDGEFLGFNCPDWDAIHVETDSDNIALFSLTGQHDRIQPEMANEASVELLRSLAFSAVVNPLHRYYFTKAIKLHSGNLNDKWLLLERQTGYIAYQVLSNLSYVPGPLAAQNPSDLLRYIPAMLMLREAIRRIGRKIVRDTNHFFRRLWSLAVVMRRPPGLQKATAPQDSKKH
jgi:hypothetical protein